jgi:hypothetical protein
LLSLDLFYPPGRKINAGGDALGSGGRRGKLQVGMLVCSRGSLVGSSEPPAGSTVIATASAPAREASTAAAVVSSAGLNVPPDLGTPSSITQIWNV